MFSTAFLDIPPLESAGGSVVLPGSKSISNRVLLLAALSGGTTAVHDLLDSDDTRVMLDALRALGCGVQAGVSCRGPGEGFADHVLRDHRRSEDAGGHLGDRALLVECRPAAGHRGRRAHALKVR